MFKKNKTMNKLCNVKPDRNVCCACMDRQIDDGVYIPCDTCELKSREYELLQICGYGRKDFAYVLFNGHIEKVRLGRIYNIRDKKEKENG